MRKLLLSCPSTTSIVLSDSVTVICSNRAPGRLALVDYVFATGAYSSTLSRWPLLSTPPIMIICTFDNINAV